MKIISDDLIAKNKSLVIFGKLVFFLSVQLKNLSTVESLSEKFLL